MSLLPNEIQKSMFALAKWGAGAKPLQEKTMSS